MIPDPACFSHHLWFSTNFNSGRKEVSSGEGEEVTGSLSQPCPSQGCREPHCGLDGCSLERSGRVGCAAPWGRRGAGGPLEHTESSSEGFRERGSLAIVGYERLVRKGFQHNGSACRTRGLLLMERTETEFSTSARAIDRLQSEVFYLTDVLFVIV